MRCRLSLLLLILLNCSCVKPRYSQTTISRDKEMNRPSLLEIPIEKELPFRLRILQKTGFTVGYSEQHRIPIWVAWQLTQEEVNGTIPKDNFSADPTVDDQADNLDYKGSGWSRGHMAPAADMKWNAYAMHECCMMTNICPQKAELNQGSWQKLERKCRETYCSKYGSVYIVCGPIIGEKISTIGPHNVVVPEGFYKVLLVKSSIGWQAVGFVYANDEGPHDMQQAACSVDDVEALTGLDFFSMLPDAVENVIESDFDWKKWQ